MPLKKAFEIASERIIASRYARELDREEAKRSKEEKERLDELPDFVAAWELSQKSDSGFGPSVVEDVKDNPTTFIPKESYATKSSGSGGIIVQEPETITFNSPMEMHWYGHFTSYSGFSRMNRAMVFGLANRNVKVKVDIQRCAIDINQATYNELQRLEATEVNPAAPKVYGATVPLSMCHGGKKILYTMMENDQTLHPDYVGKLNLFNEIWVPTRHGERIFKKNGVRPNVLVMPLGVEISRYHSKVEPFNMGDVCSFRFISVFKWGFRKGYDILLKAYMEEFSSQDDVSLILVSRSDLDNNPNRIAEDFKAVRMGIDKKDEDLPHVSLYDKHILEKDMPSVYKAGDAFVLISRGEGFGLPYCFRSGTKIRTWYNGYKNIEDIAVGDWVVSGNNYVKKVSEIHKNKYSGKFISIETNLMSEKIEVTSNHAFLSFCPSRMKNGKISAKDKDPSNWKPDWVRAENLTTDCYLAYPIMKRRQPSNKTIDLELSCKSKYIESDGKKIWLKYSNKKSFGNKDVANLAGVSKRQVEHYKQDGKIENDASKRVKAVLDSVALSDEKICLPRWVEITPKLAKLFGYYLAEGSVSNNESSVEFDFHSNESRFHEEVIDSIKDIFGLSCNVIKNGNRCRIIVCSRILANMFSFYCGKGARNKYIHNSFLFSTEESIKSLLNGYINGDGHSKSSHNSISISTVSETLARQFQHIMLDFGEYCGMTQDERGNYVCKISGFRNGNDKWIEIDERIKKSKITEKIYSNSDYIFIRITSINEYFCEDDVYNFDVPEDHSYIAGIVVAHNCEAASCGLPVIGSNCSGQSDLLTEENSYLVEPDDYIKASINGPLSRLAKHCHFYENQIFPDFGPTAIAKTREHMRYVYENYDEAMKKAAILQKHVRANCSWEKAVGRVYDRLKEIV